MKTIVGLFYWMITCSFVYAQCPSLCNEMLENTFIGINTPGIVTGTDNVFVGQAAGSFLTSGNDNTIIGRGAGVSIGGAERNTIIGNLAGRSSNIGSGNVFIGNRVGETAAVSNKLFIDNINTAIPLIYGDFETDVLRINGTFEVMAGLSNLSSKQLKQEFKFQNSAEVLEKVSHLNIMEWSYKHLPDIRHIGPTAEEFYEVFQLGEGPNSISTIDADGVALLAIQGLDKQLKELSGENKILKQHVVKMETMISALQERLQKLEADQ